MSKLFSDKKLFSEVVQMVAGNIICAFALGCFALRFRPLHGGVACRALAPCVLD